MKKYSKIIFLTLLFSLSGIGLLRSSGELYYFINLLTDNEWLTGLREKLKAETEARKTERVYLQFDKPLYKPGENVWFEAYVRNETDLKPGESEILHVELISPKGTTEKALKLILENGKAAGDFHFPSDAAGGIYKVKAYTKWQKNDERNLLFEREITLQKVVLPRLKMKLDFLRDSYGPGEEVRSSLTFQSLDNQALANHKFTYSLLREGLVEEKKQGETNEKGEAEITFKIDPKTTSPDLRLNVLTAYEGRTESVAKTVPLVLNNISLELFPEGGDLVAGLKSRLAFRAQNEFGKPADVSGIVRDEKGKSVAEFRSLHKGTGAFDFRPEAGKKYTVELVKPIKKALKINIPEVLERGFVLNISPAGKEKLKLVIRSTEKEEMSLAGSCRGKMYYTNALKINKGENTILISTKDFPTGTARFTLFDSRNIERAERLVFVNRERRLDIQISTDKEKYLPREKVTMSLKVRDERGMPVPADLSLSVTDDKLLAYADDKQANILSKLLLEPDLQGEIEEPNFYFDPKEDLAGPALDMLMLTRGWRRFKWEEIENQQLIASQPAEKTLLGGYLFRDGTAFAKQEITETTTGQKTTTDKDGYFEFKSLKLYEPAILKAGNETLAVNEYGTDLNWQTYDNRRRKLRKQMMVQDAPMIADAFLGGGGGDDENEGLQELVMIPKNEAMRAIDPQPVIPNIKKQILADRPIINLNEEKNKDVEEEIADKFDFGFAGEIAENKPEVLETIYHRAREFPAPVYKSGVIPEQRNDFRSTVFWEGNIRTDRRGKAEITFYNSDEVTSFRAIAEGIGAGGNVGHSEHLFYTQLPFSMSVKVPAEVTGGDKILIPLTLKNNTNSDLSGKLNVKLPAEWKALFGPAIKQKLKAGETATIYLACEVLNRAGEGIFAAEFSGSGQKDAFRTEVSTGFKGFPTQIGMSGNEKEQDFSFEINQALAGSLEAEFSVFPSVLGEMMSGMESILREPSGCFEQTSSSTYPNIMALQYMDEYGSDPAIAKRAKSLIDKGYKRLITFETKEKGFEWFGQTPAHEALTAYGLLEFADMSRVYGKVDQAMVNRTAEWLLARRDGAGSFERNPQALDSFGGANRPVTDAYIVWALAEAGFDSEKLRAELKAVMTEAERSQDPYRLALTTNTLFKLKHTRAEDFLKLLIRFQKSDGSFIGNEHSVTRSQGLGLKVETTSLAVLALLKNKGKEAKKLGEAVKFLSGSRGGSGGFGNTQSTVLALKALTEYAKFSRQAAEDGRAEVLLDGKKIGELSYKAGTKEAVKIKLPAGKFRDGKHKITVRYLGVKNPLPYSLSINYSSLLPASSTECALGLETELLQKKAKTGETVRLKTVLRNPRNEAQGMSMAVVGFPGCLSPQPAQLKELQEQKKFAFYEIRGNSIAFYFRQMKAGEVREINLDLKAEVPGNFEGPASRAYLYYTAEHKKWLPGLKIQIKK